MEEVIIQQNGRSIGASVYGEIENASSVTLFLHGFKGYKDWGAFPLLCEEIASRSDLPVVAINFTHNGTSIDNPSEFVDLEKFGRNTFSQELEDVYTVIVYLQGLLGVPVNINIIGHSRGGSTAILAASQFGSVKKVITWAAVIDIFTRYAFDDLERWQKEGVKYVYNGRTDQNMPLYVGLAHDLLGQRMRYDVARILNAGHKEFTLIHGKNDEAVSVKELDYVSNERVKKVVLEEVGHTFGGKEPWTEVHWPKESDKLIEETVLSLLK